MTECPNCGSDDLYWACAGHDEFGKIRVLACRACCWDEEDELG